MIFRYISGKDVFEAFYKKDLAKRLLLGKSSSIDAEKSTIGKFKTECGSQFTNKLEGMFKDVDTSRDIMAGFKNSAPVRASSSTAWSSTSTFLQRGTGPPILRWRPTPAELRDYQEVFNKYYLSKHWGGGLCAELARAVRGEVQVQEGHEGAVVSLFQTVVLMLYNDADKLTMRH